MTINEIFDALRSQSNIGYFGITVKEVSHNKPTILVHEQEDLAQAEAEFHIEYDNETLTNIFNNSTIVGYAFGETLNLKLVEIEEPVGVMPLAGPAAKPAVKPTSTKPTPVPTKPTPAKMVVPTKQPPRPPTRGR